MYLLFEVYDHYNSNGATVTELKVLNKDENIIQYDVVDAYDSYQNGVPSHWNSNIWDKTKLYNNNTYYIDNPTGQYSTTVFIWSSPANSGYWARFVIDIKDNMPSEIQIWAGSPEGRIPHNIKVFSCNNYTSSNLTQRNNDGLRFIGQIDFNGDELTVRQYSIKVTKNWFLIKENGIIKTYKNGWITLEDEPLTEFIFLVEGMTNLSIIPENAWHELSGDIEVLMYTDGQPEEETILEIHTEPFTPLELLGEKPKLLVWTDEKNTNTNTAAVQKEFNFYADLPTGRMFKTAINPRELAFGIKSIH